MEKCQQGVPRVLQMGNSTHDMAKLACLIVDPCHDLQAVSLIYKCL